MGRKQHLLVEAEHAVESLLRRRKWRRPPEHFRIEPYGGHGGPHGVVVRGRVLDDPPPSEAVEGESLGAAVRRGLGQFVTDELPGVSLRVRVGDAVAETETDPEGYFRVELQPPAVTGPWERGRVEPLLRAVGYVLDAQAHRSEPIGGPEAAAPKPRRPCA